MLKLLYVDCVGDCGGGLKELTVTVLVLTCCSKSTAPSSQASHTQGEMQRPETVSTDGRKSVWKSAVMGRKSV